METGFAYEAEGHPFSPDQMLQVQLFSDGHSKSFRNILRGAGAGREMLVFDYEYTIGHGKGSRTWNQTVVAFPVKGDIPSFKLQGETMFHRVGSVFGYQDLDFESSPEFSRRYLLRGKDEEAVRRFFHPGMVAYFESLPKHKLVVEGGAGWLVVYRLNQRSKPRTLREFLEERANIAAGILGQVSRGMGGFA